MASKSGHLATGAASGIIATIILYKLHIKPPLFILLLTFLASIPGGTAPDWLEIASWTPETGRTSLIKHRTWTHWGIPWIILWIITLFLSPVLTWAPIVFGFATGGLTHLLIDWPNPSGIPWLRVKKRHSLNFWRSGEYEFSIVIVSWAITSFIAYITWYVPVYGYFTPNNFGPPEYYKIKLVVLDLISSAYTWWH